MSAQAWWRDAVIYQIYPRSFKDNNGDGIGDLPGVTSKLDYLAELGVDALWLSPFYRSPQADAGYDVADYRDVDPLFGTLADFDAMLEGAHARGLKIIVDLVPNHTSDEHVWFKAALNADPESPERDRYMFRTGKGEHAERPPNNWQSVFGGPAWTRVEGEDQWYLHLFDSKQPDLNWENPEVRAEFEDVLRFWLDRGVDGFRVDVAHGMIKAEGLPDFGQSQCMIEGGNVGPMWDQDGVHEIYRAWRRVLDEYDGDRMMVAEAWVQPQERLARYVRPDEMQQAFNFDYLLARWNADALKSVIDTSIMHSDSVGAVPTWVMSNHDGVRHSSRLGLSDPGRRPNGLTAHDEQPDEALGLRRARALIMLTLALPGSAYVYQGEELGLPDHTTMDAKYRQDPTFHRTNGEETGRDGCRVPLPWNASQPAFGFGGEQTWLPQPENYARYAVDAQLDQSDSTLALYRTLLAQRAEHALGRGRIVWNETGRSDVLSLTNGAITVVLNLSDRDVERPEGDVIVESIPGIGNGQVVPANSAVWLGC
ncbi:glycoside hydrolase family 13 protein [Larsenimonas suaedae]|uniref:Alpha-amylase family glycosyl hydrolase n=1 Tax=Larsenimonas suaedae TaxID=1851019 RepID=A0ABU1GUG5_9GAMM|nr:alpha-amylase family glycosyl hydrolase [Larsenimonas suaedae]MCM2970920.1 glycoside hydrolase family 13 protein [Larsenimonas suaedae]MDR5895629.1 alpha-amylase family glycosyl hydrolase [Larsenimonas suaedae]